MFGKKRCSNCDKKFDKGFDFCPYCGKPFKNSADYGLLGKSDNTEDMDKLFQKSFSTGIAGSFFDKMLGSAMKMIEKEIQKIPTQRPAVNSNFELFINGKRVNLPGNIAGLQIEETMDTPKKEKTRIPQITEEVLRNSAKLPRKEAKTKLLRTADKVSYELDTPGLVSLSNVVINKLEDSIEIKAYTDKAVFFKTIHLKLPLVRYALREDKLVLEFNPK